MTVNGFLGANLVVLAATLSAMAADRAAGLDADPHLVARWKLDETSGKKAADASGHNHHATLDGKLAFDSHSVPGRAGRALQFDGTADVVTATGFKGVVGTRPRTIALWIKTTSTTGEIISWGKNDAGKMWIMCFIRNGLGVTPKGGYLYMKRGVEDGQWHHIVAVVREASPPNLHDDVKLYKDGEPAEIDDIGYLDMWPVETVAQQDVRLGCRFKGQLSDVRIYDRALAEEEVKSLFRQSSK
jgi:hypothetical protein